MNPFESCTKKRIDHALTTVGVQLTERALTDRHPEGRPEVQLYTSPPEPRLATSALKVTGCPRSTDGGEAVGAEVTAGSGKMVKTTEPEVRDCEG